MRVISILSVLTIFLALCSDAQTRRATQPQTKRTVAILDFDARGGVTKDEAATLTEIFSADLLQSGEFVVVERNRLQAVLVEQGLQQSEACAAVECVVEIGKILNVRHMFAGTIGKVGRIFTVTVQMVDVETAQIVLTKVRQHAGDIEGLLTKVMGELAAEVASELTGKQIKPIDRTEGTSWFWYATGAAVVGGGAALVILNPDFLKDLFGKKTTKQEGQLPPMPFPFE
jgi:TolB-like protein